MVKKTSTAKNSTDLVRRIVFQLQAERVKGTKRDVQENFKAGDTIEVHNRIREGDKERIQVFRGLVIKVQGSGMGRSFTVRKISSGVGVEKTFPFASPAVERIKLVSRGSVRRSRIYYIRKLRGKAARITSEWVRETTTPKAVTAPSANKETTPAHDDLETQSGPATESAANAPQPSSAVEASTVTEQGENVAAGDKKEATNAKNTTEKS